MTLIKLCGLRRLCDVEAANALRPDCVGFVFAKASRRYISPDEVRHLRGALQPGIQAVGVFVRENPEQIAALLNEEVIDMAQLHGGEDDDYVKRLRALTDRPIIQAYRVGGRNDLDRARRSAADLILLDSGAGGTGSPFDWALLRDFDRPYFLAGGLNPDNVAQAIDELRPFGVDVSSGIETDGFKDIGKMKAFVATVRTIDESLQIKSQSPVS
ncbi:MAG: phosphoribosylanthranilate isomerase [Clostridia bacterium]|nr:phosphoribosylanthranilate isomerase [Clostridia bacterium]